MPNIFDRAVAYIDPIKGAKRMHARAMMGAYESYTGASTSKRSMFSWLTRAGSANADTLPDMKKLWERSRHLSRNTPLATGAINTNITSVIGTGLSLQSRVDTSILKLSPERAAAWQKITEAEFRLWSENPQYCDITRTQDFYQQQGTAYRGVLESGDIFCIMPYVARPNEPYGLKLQLIEADRVCNPGNVADTDTLVAGIQLDAVGAPLGYNVSRYHPGDLRIAGRQAWSYYPAFAGEFDRRAMLHIFERLRPEQARGVPYLAPVIEPLKQLDRYTEAEITAAVVSSFFSVFIYTEAGTPSAFDSATTGQATQDGQAESWDGRLSPGLVAQLSPNEKIETANPGRPNPVFDQFFMAVARQIGVALQLPFEVLVKHFTASYTAARAALLEAWRFFRVRREFMSAMFCQPVYELWLDEAVASGRISAPGYFSDPLVRWAWSRAYWSGDGPGAVDPLKEVLAAKERVELEITTRAEEKIAYDGGDWDATHVQAVKEHNMRKRDGLLPPEMQQPAAPAREPEREEPDSDEETE